jgi:REP element-mobilizing transposase RayT
MNYDPNKHHRRSIRLQGYDYHNPGAYFVTICTKDRECILDDSIVNAILHDVWYALPKWFPTIGLDEFIVMPNHTHFVVWNHVGTPVAGIPGGNVHGGVEADFTSAPLDEGQPLDGGKQWDEGRPLDEGKPRPYKIPQPQKTNTMPALGEIVGAFKSLVFKVYLDWIKVNDPSRRAKFWQGNYYEHIIRNDRDLDAIRQYIIDNPINWKIDRDNLKNLRQLPPPEKVEDYHEDLKL